MEMRYKTYKWNNDIAAVEIEKETPRFYVYGGYRHAKQSSDTMHHDTYAEALDYVIERCQSRIASYYRNLKAETDELHRLIGLK
jgi:hypothetical protein